MFGMYFESMSSAKPAFKLHPKLARAQGMMEKRMSFKDVLVNPSFEQPYINTGSSILNMLIGGSRLGAGRFVCPGWPKASMVEIFGRESSGKSTIALMAMGNALKEGGDTGVGLYVDLEHAVKDNYAQKLGCDFRPVELGGHGRCQRVAPHSFEETEQIVNAYALNGVDMIVIDSVAGLVSKKELQRDTMKDNAAVAEIPRLMSAWMPKLQSIISKTSTCVIFINQTRDKIGAFGFNEETLKSTVGGNSLKFWASLRIMLTPKQQAKAKRWNPLIKEHEEVPVSTDVLVKMIKNKIDARQGHTGLVTIRYGVGMDELRTMLNVATAYDIVKHTKNGKKQDVYTYKSPSGHGVVEAIGIEKFRAALRQNNDAYSEMIAASIECVSQGFKAIEDEELAQLAEDAVTNSMEDLNNPADDYENMTPDPEPTVAVAGVDYDEALLNDDSKIDTGLDVNDL